MAARVTWSAPSTTSPVIVSLAIKVVSSLHTYLNQNTYLCNHGN